MGPVQSTFRRNATLSWEMRQRPASSTRPSCRTTARPRCADTVMPYCFPALKRRFPTGSETATHFAPRDNLFADPICFVIRGPLDPMPDLESFWPDGMARATGREFSGLIESPCYQRGSMWCLSCHEMHQKSGDMRTPAEWAAGQLKTDMDGNLACVQCHNRFEDAAVTAQHTHHKADSSGSKCYNCHMPHTTYGLLKAARSHMVNSPNVSECLQAGRPNACNLCHQDKTLAWSAENLSLWYKHAIPKLSADEESIAASVLWALRGDAGQRALTAWSFSWSDAHPAFRLRGKGAECLAANPGWPKGSLCQPDSHRSRRPNSGCRFPAAFATTRRSPRRTR